MGRELEALPVGDRPGEKGLGFCQWFFMQFAWDCHCGQELPQRSVWGDACSRCTPVQPMSKQKSAAAKTLPGLNAIGPTFQIPEGT